jgi:multidrug efflux system outer membrane protein
MRRSAALLAILATGCASMEPAYVRSAPPIPASWPAGDAYLRQSEVALPAVTYRQVFRDPRLQALIEQALVNNRDMQIAAANIAAGRARYRIQRAQQ